MISSFKVKPRISNRTVVLWKVHVFSRTHCCRDCVRVQTAKDQEIVSEAEQVPRWSWSTTLSILSYTFNVTSNWRVIALSREVYHISVLLQNCVKYMYGSILGQQKRCTFFCLYNFSRNFTLFSVIKNLHFLNVYYFSGFLKSSKCKTMYRVRFVLYKMYANME